MDQNAAILRIRDAKASYEDEMRRLEVRQRRLVEAVVARIDQEALARVRQEMNA